MYTYYHPVEIHGYVEPKSVLVPHTHILMSYGVVVDVYAAVLENKQKD